MAQFHDPATRLERAIFGLAFDFLAARTNVRDVSRLLDDLLFAHVTRIQTEILRRPVLSDLNHFGLKKLRQFGAVVTIGGADDDRQRDAMFVDQQMTFAPFFSPDPSGWDRPIRGPGAP